MGTAQLGQVFGNSGQCLGRKLGNFYFLFPPNISLYSHTQFILCSMQSLILLFIYSAVPKAPQYCYCTEGEKNINLCPPLYCHHIHPLSTLAERTHVQQSSWKATQAQLLLMLVNEMDIFDPNMVCIFSTIGHPGTSCIVPNTIYGLTNLPCKVSILAVFLD